MVVLAACQTANGQQLLGEGVSNLARPFLASGVPMVIASLWDADDFASSSLFISFHKHRLNGEDVFSALRLAQLESLRSDNSQLNSPSKWALFVLFGGSLPNDSN